MKNNIINNIEQIFNELVKQDPSFASQKKEILSIITRMIEHTPSVSIDHTFQSTLKSRLENHIQYINNLKVNPPQINPRINRLARFISYGLPAVAFGLIVFLALPYQPTTVNKSNTVPLNIETIDHSSQTPIIETPVNQLPQVQDKQIIPRSIPTISSENKKTPLLQQAPIEDTIPMDWAVPDSSLMMKTSTPLLWSDQMSTSDGITSKPVDLLQTTDKVKVYHITDNDSFSYTIDQAWDDIILQWVLEYCKNHYTINENLVWVSADSLIIVESKNPTTQNKKRITLQFTDNQLTDIQGLEDCK